MKKTISLALLSALLLTGCGATATQPSKEQPVSSDQVNQHPAFIMAGKIEAADKVDVISKISGRVAELKVDVGSVVKKGDVLLRYDAKEIETLIKSAESAVSKAKDSVDSTAALYENAKLNYERTLKLYEGGASSKQALETADAARKTAEAQYQTAKSQLEVASSQLIETTVTAPVSGVVSMKSLNPGELAVNGATLLSIANPKAIYVNAYLPARLSGEVKPGQKALIRISEIPEKTVEGEITAISPVVDSKSKSIIVKVSLPENDLDIKIGMFAQIALKK